MSLSDDGNTLAVGANAEDSNATGINGNQQDNSMQSAGAAYIFVRNGVAWTQQAYVKAPNTAPNVQFGYSVALSADGNTFAVSSFDEGGASRVINGPYTPGRNGTGAIYIYTRAGAAWTQQAYLKASNAENGDSLGVAVSISDDGNTVAGGILDEDCLATGVNPSNACDNGHGVHPSGHAVGAAGVHQGVEYRQGRLVRLAAADQRRRQHARHRRAARGQRGAGHQRQAGRRQRSGSRCGVLLHAHRDDLGTEVLRQELE